MNFANFQYMIFITLLLPQFSSDFNSSLWKVWHSGGNTGYYVYGDLSCIQNVMALWHFNTLHMGMRISKTLGFQLNFSQILAGHSGSGYHEGVQSITSYRRPDFETCKTLEDVMSATLPLGINQTWWFQLVKGQAVCQRPWSSCSGLLHYIGSVPHQTWFQLVKGQAVCQCPWSSSSGLLHCIGSVPHGVMVKTACELTQQWRVLENGKIPPEGRSFFLVYKFWLL